VENDGRDKLETQRILLAQNEMMLLRNKFTQDTFKKHFNNRDVSLD
jgi:hypothetical protein